MNDTSVINTLQAIVRANKDFVNTMQAAYPTDQTGDDATPGLNEARVLVDFYYAQQEFRKALTNQIGAIDRGADSGVSHAAADLLLTQSETMEHNAKLFLESLAVSHAMSPWFAAVHGVGPVLAAGLLAHLGSRPVPPTVGHWWRFAGLDPSQRWEGTAELGKRWDALSGSPEERLRVIALEVGRDPASTLRDATTDFRTGEPLAGKLTKAKAVKALARRPYNRGLKTLLWKVVDQFVKLGERDQSYLYAQFYRRRKAEEVRKNEAGRNAEAAARVLAAKPNHAQRATYAEGKLPDSHVDARARRATAKLFLSHLHELWYQVENNTPPPKPFAIAVYGHGHYIPPYYAEALFPESAAA